MNKDRPRKDLLRTRRMIKNAFIELLDEKELEQVSINMITRHANINRVTFYSHYRDMKDFLEKLADDMVEEFRSILSKRSVNSNLSEDKDFTDMVSLLEYIAEHAKFYKVVLGSRKTSFFTERLQLLVGETILQRFEEETDIEIIAAEIPKDIAIWYGSSALLGTIVDWLQNDMPYTPTYLAQQFFLLRSYSLSGLTVI